MSDTVKVIIEIPKDKYERCKEYRLMSYDAEILEGAVARGILLNDAVNEERAEVQAYFAGEAYGWEQGRKALIEDVKAEIDEQYKWLMQTKHTLYDIDIAFSGIKAIIDSLPSAVPEREKGILEKIEAGIDPLDDSQENIAKIHALNKVIDIIERLSTSI